MVYSVAVFLGVVPAVEQFLENWVHVVARDSGDVADARPVEEVAAEVVLESKALLRRDSNRSDFEDSGEQALVKNGPLFFFRSFFLGEEGRVWVGGTFAEGRSIEESRVWIER